MSGSLALEPDDDKDEFDPWMRLGLQCGGYNSDVDHGALAVLRCIRDGVTWVEDIARTTGQTASHVELWQYIFSSAKLCEYGTSPRGCWPVNDAEFAAFISQWEAWLQDETQDGSS